MLIRRLSIRRPDPSEASQERGALILTECLVDFASFNLDYADYG
jgi:hypothetical protein